MRILALLLAVLALPLVAAGGEVVQAQFDAALAAHIAEGERIITYVQQHGRDSSALEAALDELRDFRQEARSMTPDAFRAGYADLRREASQLIAAFREVAHGVIPAQERAEVRRESREYAEASAQELRDIAHQRRLQYNADRIQEIIDRMEIEDSADVVRRVREGEISVAEARQAIAAYLQSLATDRRQAALEAQREREARLAAERVAREREWQALQEERAQLLREREARIAAAQQAASDRQAIARDREGQQTIVDRGDEAQAYEERERLAQEQERLRQERERLAQERAEQMSQRDTPTNEQYERPAEQPPQPPAQTRPDTSAEQQNQQTRGETP